MQTFWLILLSSAVLVGLCFLGLAVKILLKKNGKFSHTCAFDWDKNRCKDCQADCSQCQKDIKKMPKIKL